MSVGLTRISSALIACALTAGICAADDPAPATTQPGAGLDPVVFVQRLEKRIDSISLTDAQKASVQEVIEKAQEQATALEAEIQNARPIVKLQRMETFARGVRQQLATILSPEELQELRPGPGTTQPAGGGGEAGLPFFQRFKSAIDQLDLNDNQKTQIADLMSQMRTTLQELRQNANGRGAGRQAVTDIREKIIQILTPDQRQKLRDLLTGAPDQTVSPATAENAPPPMVMTPDNPDQSAKPPAASNITLRTDAPVVASAVMGQVAPPVHLLTPGNAAINFSTFKGRVVVMEFGSISCPTFRDHVAAMEHLRATYGARAYFLVVYTREQHPIGGWESPRNQQDGISVPQPVDMAARQSQANQARIALHITLPIAVDDMDDAVTNAYGGFPEATIVIGRDGKITGRQQWTDPSGLPRLIDAAIAAK